MKTNETGAGGLREGLKAVKLIAMDVDGVLTDGRICLDQEGRELKSFSALDGMGIVLARRAGLPVVFITARGSKAVRARAAELGVDAIYENRKSKTAAFNSLLERFRFSEGQVCYIGDDLMDLPVLRRAGFPVAVSNAVPDVKKAARYVTKTSGGSGAVREVVERILKAQGLWKKVLDGMLQ